MIFAPKPNLNRCTALWHEKKKIQSKDMLRCNVICRKEDRHYLLCQLGHVFWDSRKTLSTFSTLNSYSYQRAKFFAFVCLVVDLIFGWFSSRITQKLQNGCLWNLVRRWILTPFKLLLLIQIKGRIFFFLYCDIGCFSTYIINFSMHNAWILMRNIRLV